MTKYYVITWRTVDGRHGGTWNHLDKGEGEKGAIRSLKKHLRRFHPSYNIRYTVDVFCL